MEVKILNSNSAGNCYILEAANGILILELGVSGMDIKKALNFDLSKVVGSIVTHEHGDHSKAIIDVAKMGINVYASHGTFKALNIEHPRLKSIKAHEVFEVGPFKIMPFDVVHDAYEPLGFLINHEESGNILFVTDTAHIQYKFDDLNQIFVEANYCEDILIEKSNTMHPKLSSRIRNSHMSIQTCSELLAANDLTAVSNIVLIHLSDGNSDEKRFKETIRNQTGKSVYIASKGLEIGLNKSPF